MTFIIQQTLLYAVPLMIVALAGVFSERSLSSRFPFGYADRQAKPNGSFISSWKGSKLCPTHVHR